METLCGLDTIRGISDNTPLLFPYPDLDPVPENVTEHTLSDGSSKILAVGYPSIRKAQLLDLEGSPSRYRFKWLDIPATFTNSNTTSAGLVVLRPQRKTTPFPDNTEHDIIACRIDAGWGRSSMNTSTIRESSTTVSSLPDLSSTFLHKSYPLDQFNSDENALHQTHSSYYQGFVDAPLVWQTGVFPQVPIKITPEWASFLNPIIPGLNGSVFEVLLTDIEHAFAASTVNTTLNSLTQYLLSLQTANALARVGFDNFFEGIPKTIQVVDPSVPGGNYTDIDGTAWISAKEDFFYLNPEDGDKNWAEFRVTSTIKGYAYNIDGFAPKVAISFLLTYCTVALIHVFYSGVTGTRLLHHLPILHRVVLTFACYQVYHLQRGILSPKSRPLP